ncbi:MAG: bifunctional demethylmenaquinone methyltransferase/2-methoxy-6-polyprenyl-1,4-benzoquinol methylase UbiE [bacterium]|nr:bifunctional demethylmenaquinone methyltransferase/2-methoxy-6-polyprenyl-1,4-benzoquinol methylase UbiE [bacterium]
MNQPEGPSRKEAWLMFDRIAHRYDLLNLLLSAGQDKIWRKKVAEHLPNRPNMKLLDLAAGTGDLAIELVERNKNIKKVLITDMSTGMLDVAKKKVAKKNLSAEILIEQCDATNIQYPDDSFDIITIAFGIRNVTDVSQALKSMHRVLKSNGRMIVLELSLPNNRLLRSLYLFYFRHILPIIGGIISGNTEAYKYLNQTVESFPYGDDFCNLMKKAGFKNANAFPQTLGIATIYVGEHQEDALEEKI